MKSVFLMLCFLTFFSQKGFSNECPIFFQKSEICARVDWLQGPTADGESSFELTLLKTVPDVKVGVYLRMSCCGTIKVPKTFSVTSEKYTVNQIQFTPGVWEVHIKLESASGVEEQSFQVNLND